MKKLIKKISIYFTLSLIVVMTLGCSKNNEKLVVGVMTDVDSIPFIVAKQQGYLPDYVELQIFTSPVNRDGALYSNNLDGTISDVLAVCLAKESEFNVLITSMTQGKYGLVASKGSNITSVDQINDSSIALSLNTIIEYVTDNILVEEGVGVEMVKKTAVPNMPSRLELLTNNQIDLIAVPEPYVTAAVKEGGILLKTSTDLNINPGVMLFTKEATENKSMEIKEFYNAYNKAVDFINENINDKEVFMNEVIKELGLPDAANDIELPKYTHHTMPSEQEVKKAVYWLLEKELIKTKFEYKDLIWEKND